jgi:hypothetical protein
MQSGWSESKDSLQDHFLIQRIAKLEKKIEECKITLRKAQEEASAAYFLANEPSLSTTAKSDRERILRLKKQIVAHAEEALKQAEQTFDRVLNHPKNSGALILSLLQGSSPSEAKQPHAKPLIDFTDTQIEKILTRYSELTGPLKDLMDAALGEDVIVTLEINTRPVFIIGDGRIYDAAALKTLFGQGANKKTEATLPLNQGFRFKESDIIPCNSLIKALGHLLSIIDGEEIEAKSLESRVNNFVIIHQNHTPARTRISADLIKLIEQFLKTLPPKHQLLFDEVCRDRVTRQIMDDPVILTDGFFYDRKTAEAALEAGGICPSNENIIFTERDITPCITVGNVLNKLKEIILKKLSLAQPAQSEAQDTPQQRRR